MPRSIPSLFFTALLLAATLCALPAEAQPLSQGAAPMGLPSRSELAAGLDMSAVSSSMTVQVNAMDAEKRQMLNRTAAQYRNRARGSWTQLGQSMLAGGLASVVNVVTDEIIELIKIRSKQKREWEQMRSKECLFVDSLQSVFGQSDFYARTSTYGPLDPEHMNFDGITFSAFRQGREVLHMVCHIDTTRLDHMFRHSKFYLVLDSLMFRPYDSYLPNLQGNRISRPEEKKHSAEQQVYWDAISRFSYAEQGTPVVQLRLDITSSWMNSITQVFHDVHLGSFGCSVAVSETMLRDSVFTYSRAEALAHGRELIQMSGDCFVVPRSYMPVAASSPSWGTGEYKMKVVLAERANYNREGERARHWHRDYKAMKKLQNQGRAHNDYLNSIVTTFRDNSTSILKATYKPAITYGVQQLGLSSSPTGAGAMPSGLSGAAGGMPQGAGSMPQQGGAPK